jgi:hypothetical protein
MSTILTNLQAVLGLPTVYTLRGYGDCMGEEEDGTPRLFDQLSPCNPGDLVVVYLRSSLEREDGQLGLLKRYLGVTPDGRVALEQDHPHRRVAVQRGKLVAMHRCVGKVEEVQPGKVAIDWSRVAEARSDGAANPDYVPAALPGAS